MKKILLLAITIFSINSVFAQSQRLVFVEEFTQASCPPCETTTPALNALMNANTEKVVQLRYQTSWPGVDPMNADNPQEVQDRVDYYGVTGVPNLLYDGGNTNIPSNQAALDNAYSQNAPVAMTLQHTLADDLSSISVTLTVTNEGTEAYSDANNKLRVALVEEEISWDTPPGSTSIQVFEAVMKTFLTGTAGMDIPEIAAGETWTQTWEDLPIAYGMYTFRELGVVAFIQNDATRRVEQSAHSAPVELLGDFPNAEITNTSSTDGDLCDYSFVGTARVINSGNLDAVGYDVDMYINGSLEQTITSEETLAAGASASISFDEITLPIGTSNFNYILRLKEGDISSINNITSIGTIGKAAGVIADFTKNMEELTVSSTEVAEGLIVERPDDFLNFTAVSQAFIGGDDPVGGFGESDQSISIYLWGWDPTVFDPNGSMIIADQYEVPASGIDLSFDYAYTSWGGSVDRLIVEVSTDCGISFDEVFNQAGEDLRTGDEINVPQLGGFWRPGADEWRTVETNLDSYAGETILLRFRVVSGYGDMIYLDNIDLKVITDVNELGENESLNVYPNPASTSVNVVLTTANAAKVNLRVIDMLGRTVQSQNLGTVSGKINHALDVSSLTNGSYLLFMNVDGRDVVKRLSVAH